MLPASPPWITLCPQRITLSDDLISLLPISQRVAVDPDLPTDLRDVASFYVAANDQEITIDAR